MFYSLIYFLFCLYIAILPFGQLFRFGHYGISTVLFSFLVMFSFIHTLSTLRFNKRLFITLLLTIYTLLMSIAYITVYDHVFKSLSMCGYVFLAYSSYLMCKRFSDCERRILNIIFISTSISACFTILSYFKIVDLSYFSENFYVTRTIGETVINVSNGLFNRSTAMASYFLFPLSALLISFFVDKEKLLNNNFKFIYFILILLSLMFSSNRAAILSSFISIFLILIIFQPKIFLKLFLPFYMILYLTLSYLADFSPTIEFYFKIFSFENISFSESQAKSDMSRFLYFKEVIAQFSGNIMGYGKGELYNYKNQAVVNPHNSISNYNTCRCSCILFIFYLMVKSILFIKDFYYNQILKNSLYMFMTISSLLSAFLFNQVHISLNNGFLWIIIGLFCLSIRKTI